MTFDGPRPFSAARTLSLRIAIARLTARVSCFGRPCSCTGRRASRRASSARPTVPPARPEPPRLQPRARTGAVVGRQPRLAAARDEGDQSRVLAHVEAGSIAPARRRWRPPRDAARPARHPACAREAPIRGRQTPRSCSRPSRPPLRVLEQRPRVRSAATRRADLTLATPGRSGGSSISLTATCRGRATMYAIASAMSSACIGCIPPNWPAWPRAPRAVVDGSSVAIAPGSTSDTRTSRFVTLLAQ